MRDAGHRTPDIGHRTAKKAKIIYPPPRGVDIITQGAQVTSSKPTMGHYYHLQGFHFYTTLNEYKYAAVQVTYSEKRLHTVKMGLPPNCLDIKHYKDRKCTVNENWSLRIVTSKHYNARDLIAKVVPQTGYRL